MPRMRSAVDSEVSQLIWRADLMELPRMGSETPRMTFDFLEGFERFSSRSDFKSSLTMP